MPGSVVIFVCLVMLFLLFHESGHIIAAKICRLTVRKAGLKWVPVPHLYVIVDASVKQSSEYIFYFSGFFATLLLFAILYATDLLRHDVIYYAIALQVVLDSNPFFSDFTLAFSKEYKYSKLWYLHFVLWGVLLGFLFSRPSDVVVLFSTP